MPESGDKKTGSPEHPEQKPLDESGKEGSESLLHKLLVYIYNKLVDILDELRGDDDEGEYMFVQGTATTDLSQNIQDLLGIMGHPVRQILFKNDDLVTTIQLGYNITPSSIDSDVQTASARFFPVFPGEKFRAPHKRKVIRNVYIRTTAGTGAYRMWLFW